VSAKSDGMIEQIFEIFESGVNDAKILKAAPPPKRPFTVFIGHGRSDSWRRLESHLRTHSYNVEAYETGARAGHTIRDVLELMLNRSSVAVLVLTGEDETVDGQMRARQNVIHEMGLFQGRLGFHRTFILLEEGCEEFSNIQGIQAIRFAPGNIREAFGDAVAAIKREEAA
jgi:predicted nucleotide-binding protein